MAASMKVFVPEQLVGDIDKLKSAVNNALSAAARGAKVDFNVTARTWEHKPEFKITNPAKYMKIVSTDDAIYGYVNFGTKPHIIVPRNGKVLTWIGANYRPKTRPRVIGSNKGGNDNTVVYTKMVQHPGTEARHFDETIAEKWQKELPVIMQRALDSWVNLKEFDFGHAVE